MVEGKKQVNFLIGVDEWKQWKDTGMRASFVFLKGFEFFGMQSQLKEKDKEIESINKARLKLQDELLKMDERADRLEKANLILQEENIKLRGAENGKK